MMPDQSINQNFLADERNLAYPIDTEQVVQDILVNIPIRQKAAGLAKRDIPFESAGLHAHHKLLSVLRPSPI